LIEAGLKPPETLTLMITRGCNSNCLHCLLDCRPAEHVRPVDSGIIKRIIDEFAGIGGKGLVITGGEPLTHPDWMEILAFACSRRGLLDVCLQTNGALMSDDDIQGLLSLPIDRLSLQISLEGVNSGTHDHVRGKGSFEATVKTMGRLCKAGLGERITVELTEMSHNYDQLPEVVKLVHDLGMRRLVSGTLVKGGRALRSDLVAMPEPSQIRGLIERYHTDPEFREIYEYMGNIAAIEWFKGRDNPCDTPCRCISTPFIDYRGNIYPCLMYLKDSLAFGNVHERPLGAVIAEAIPMWAELPDISRERGTVLNDCEGCPGRRHCSGGCMGRADLVHDNVMSVEDRCDLRRAVYSWELGDNEHTHI